MYSCFYTGNLKHIRQGWVLEHERKNGWAHEIVPEKSSTQRVTGNLFIFLSLDRPGEPVRHIFILSGAPLSKSKFLGFIPGCLYDTTCDPKISQLGNFVVAPTLHYLACPAELQASCLIQFSKDHPDAGEEGPRGDRASSHLQCQIGDGQDEKEKWYELRKKDISSKAQWGHDSYA